MTISRLSDMLTGRETPISSALNRLRHHWDDPGDAIDAYIVALLAVYAAWRRKWIRRFMLYRDSSLFRQAANELTDDLQDLAIEWFPFAYLAGALTLSLSLLGETTINRYLGLNHQFLTSKLALAVVSKLQSIPVDEWGNKISIDVTLDTLNHRVSLYSQPFWALIGEGVGDQAHRLEAISRSYRVRRTLDDLIEHCATCPPKARTYDSWDEMIAFCGGVPGSLEANDDCGPACRCGLEILT